MSVGAKHLEDKLSVIAKNSSPNASPVQLSVVSCQLSVVSCQLLVVSCQLSVVSCQLSVVSCQLQRNISLPYFFLLSSF
ncbi:MAG: hypothetical protein HEQ24_11100 [Dolichospermum sp. BR01]|nr:hypothetical protein [Dolichospermum sp. BR01]